MRRYTLVSIAMLGGLVAAPACGAVLGIDTDRVPLTDGGTSSGSTNATDGNAPVSDRDSGGTASDGGTDSGPARTCNATACSGIGGTCVDDKCELDCSDGATKCNRDIDCPPGHECLIKCEKDGCKDVTCHGDACTFDCSTGGDCNASKCESVTCTFLCGQQGSPCDNAECQGDNTTCAQVCFGPQGQRVCPKGVQCCATDDDENPVRVCPPNSHCGD